MARACEGCEDDRRESSKSERGGTTRERVRRTANRHRARDEERRPKAEHRSRLGRVWRGAVAVKTSLRPHSQHRHRLSLREFNTQKHRTRLGRVWRGAARVRSRLAFGLTLTEFNTPNQESRGLPAVCHTDSLPNPPANHCTRRLSPQFRITPPTVDGDKPTKGLSESSADSHPQRSPKGRRLHRPCSGVGTRLSWF